MDSHNSVSYNFHMFSDGWWMKRVEFGGYDVQPQFAW